jgi:hypothetical protein
MGFIQFVQVLVATASALGVGFLGSGLIQKRSTYRIKELREQMSRDRKEVFTSEDLDELPEPVSAYFENVLDEGQSYVNSVRVEQEGKLRPDTTSSWKSFTATQHITVDPPGFFWNASVSIAPFVSLRIHDVYTGGDGSANVSLFGIITLDGADPSPELNEAELQRYLAESVWYPTALLPSEGVQWEAIDDSAAEATLEYGGVSASLTFRFSENDVVTEVHAEERARRVDDGYEPTPWTGSWHDYETRNGMTVPLAGEVVWHLSEGDMKAWQGKVTDISYDEL